MRYWTKSWGLVHGCTPIGDACLHCWAAKEAYTRNFQKNPKIRALYEGLTYLKDGIPTFNGTVRLNEAAMEIPLRTKKPTVFAVAWGGDLFHKDVPFSFLADAFSVMGRCPQHTFLVLTKRPRAMASFINAYKNAGGYYPNVYLGTTVEDQKQADERLPALLKCAPFPLWLSIEPMLGEISFRWALWAKISREPGAVNKHLDGLKGISQVVLGGETGSGARPMNPDWAMAVRDQCSAAGVPFFFKGHGGLIKHRLFDGREHNDLRWR